MMLGKSNERYVKSSLLVDDHFTDNRNNWEISDYLTEKSIVTGEGYYLENNVHLIWNYYQIPTTLNSKDSFVFDTTFQVINRRNGLFGSFGVLWGFSMEPKILNKFAVDSRRKAFAIDTLVRRYDINVNVQFGNLKSILHPAIYRLVVLKIHHQYYFFVNDIKNPICPPCNIHHWYGSFFGIYNEPMIVLLIKHFRIRKLENVPSRITRFDKLIEGY